MIKKVIRGSGEIMKSNNMCNLLFSQRCISCGEGDPMHECKKSQNICGHHCNHIWTHDHCDWCGYDEVSEESVIGVGQDIDQMSDESDM